ncbi:hypothetical protein LEP1GSC043_1395 [Leptospira weilii str. Ecochallenge]|uniref:Uncharacterized protein n=1 Tax=Leptospira weilii str. Ecochallenge TaxID=1049986 RepID=N1U931_9LEPT|nr:hypothetical protein LEP1GSC043_1395 [Leptospira weilii str. Ecochallenge]
MLRLFFESHFFLKSTSSIFLDLDRLYFSFFTSLKAVLRGKFRRRQKTRFLK